MKLHLSPASSRLVGIVTLKSYLALECELHPVDLVRGGQRTPAYGALNPNTKIPILKDDSIVLWESNAILFYLATKRPERGLWPADPKSLADVPRWLFWQSMHWDAQVLRHGLIREGLETGARARAHPTRPSLPAANRTSTASPPYSTTRSRTRPGWPATA